MTPGAWRSARALYGRTAWEFNRDLAWKADRVSPFPFQQPSFWLQSVCICVHLWLKLALRLVRGCARLRNSVSGPQMDTATHGSEVEFRKAATGQRRSSPIRLAQSLRSTSRDSTGVTRRAHSCPTRRHHWRAPTGTWTAWRAPFRKQLKKKGLLTQPLDRLA